jgi:hypothetical protein
VRPDPATAPSEGAAYGEPDFGTDPSDPRAERRRLAALADADPGPSWREWLYGEAFKWWLGLALVVVDGWILAAGIEAAAWIPLGIAAVAAVYLEYLLYQYLWHPYQPELRGKFRRSWVHPFEVGRWCPEHEWLSRGLPDPNAAEAPGPDPRNFL